MKKIKLILLLFSLTIGFKGLVAQGHVLEVNSIITNGSLDTKYRFKSPIAYSIGIGYGYYFSEKRDKNPFGVSSGVSFFTSDDNVYIRTNQFSIPLMGHIQAGKKFKFNLGIGPSWDYIINFRGTDGYFFSLQFESDLRKSSISVNINLSFKYLIAKRHNVGLRLNQKSELTNTGYIEVFGSGKDYKIPTKLRSTGIGLFYEFQFNKRNE